MIVDVAEHSEIALARFRWLHIGCFWRAGVPAHSNTGIDAAVPIRHIGL